MSKSVKQTIKSSKTSSNQISQNIHRETSKANLINSSNFEHFKDTFMNIAKINRPGSLSTAVNVYFQKTRERVERKRATFRMETSSESLRRNGDFLQIQKWSKNKTTIYCGLIDYFMLSTPRKLRILRAVVCGASVAGLWVANLFSDYFC